MTTDQTTGTTAQNGGDAAVTQTTGTSEAAGRNAESEAERIKKLEAQVAQGLAEKATLEATKAERDALAQQLDAMSRQPPTAGVDTVMANIQAKYQELLYRAQALQDPDAQFQLALIAGNQQQIAQARHEGAIAALPADEQDAVKDMLRKSPNLDISTARQIVQGDLAKKRVRDYEAKEEEAKRFAEEQTRAAGAGTTAIRSAPATDIKTGTMKASAFNAQMAALKAKVDQGDRNARNEALALGRKVDTGEIVLVYGE